MNAVEVVEAGLSAWERAGTIGLALLALACFVAPAFGVLVWVVRTNRTDRENAAKDRKEEVARTEARFDRLIESNTLSKQALQTMMDHVTTMHDRGAELAEKLIVTVGSLSQQMTDINHNINAVHTRFDNHIGGRERERGKASNE